MRDVRNRHIIRKLQIFEPLLPAIEHRRPKTIHSPFAPVMIDLRHPLHKLFTIFIQSAIMIQILHSDFKTTLAYRFQKSRRNFISSLRDHLERRLHSVSIVNIHELSAEIPAQSRFDIMGHDRGTRSTLRPEPDKWNSLHFLRLEFKKHHAFKQIVHAPINRPMRKRYLIPAFEMNSLKILSDLNRQDWTHTVIRGR